jgi:dipeptidyl aminopeptidase/acylaminoacyl peptidase
MKVSPRSRTVLTLAGALVALQWSFTAVPSAIEGQAAQSAPQSTASTVKRPLTYDVVDYWKSIQGTRLSDDGQWLAYATTAQAEDGELTVRNLRTGQQFKHARGTSPQFTPDGKFVIFTIAQPKAEEERENAAAAGETPAAEPAGRQGRGGNARAREPRTGLGILTLADGQVKTFEKVGSFSLPEKSSTWLAYHKGLGGTGGGRGGGRGAGRGGGAPAGRGATAAAEGGGRQGASREKRKDPGADLIVRNLATGEEVTIPEVNEYEWNKNGDWIAYAVSSNDAAKDGAFARHVADGTVKTLHTGRGHYKSLAFDEAGTQLAFLSDEAEYAQNVSPYRLYYWKTSSTLREPQGRPEPSRGATSAGQADAQATEIASASTAGMPKGMVVSEFAAPRFSKDGTRLFLGTGAPPAATPDPNDKTPEPIKVDLWSYKDPLIQPMQRVRDQQERQRNYRAVIHLASKQFVQLATPDLPNVNAADDPTQVIGTSDMPYRQEISWDQTYNDVYLLDLKSGKPKKVLEHWGNAATMSPAGKYVLHFDERTGHWLTYRVADGVRVNLTEKLPVKFQQENNTPDLPGPYGTGGWTADDKSVLLYDKFDIWEVKPDGTGAHMITSGEGRKQQLVFRYRSLDPDEQVVPVNTPLLLPTTNDVTRASGFYRLNSLASTTAPEKVVMLDKAFGAPTKAKHADTLVFTLSRTEEFPDLWVSDTTFKDITKVSDANPQQANYIMGKSELIDYVNADGKKLRAMLTKPENFDPNKKYPLMVYIYEELTQGLHSYSAPNVGTSINIPRYVSNGYIVLRPDIVYETGYPGQSAEKCVIPAVQTVLAMGFIDPKRIGIQGHSWGGYQITYLVTRTNMFAAVEAGASVSNMVSAYGGIRWGTGMSRAFQYEKTQSRIGAPPWDAPLQFIENSPIFWVKKVQTPYLTIHNDEDDAVPWQQGIEWISAMRRLGKEAYMFTFNGERHGLGNRDNMKYWTVHMDEFFDHYLLGKPRPEWMDKGVPYQERGKREIAPLFKKKSGTTSTSQPQGRP